MELREIEIFLALAEELHFGRVAERLHVSVAAVSKAIKKQERAVGVELFARDSRNVRLTPVGEQLRDDLRQVYQGLTQSLERARLAARGKTGTLRVSLFPVNVQELRRYFESSAPGTRSGSCACGCRPTRIRSPSSATGRPTSWSPGCPSRSPT
ncbi:LysR family transcriptional regulator [Nonomuraea rosea]|uniref:LysR family transcriptional regulator n=1 Tax=Nonomuraea rosea TaxID=638574 RepID=UPI0031E700B5